MTRPSDGSVDEARRGHRLSLAFLQSLHTATSLWGCAGSASCWIHLARVIVFAFQAEADVAVGLPHTVPRLRKRLHGSTARPRSSLIVSA